MGVHVVSCVGKNEILDLHCKCGERETNFATNSIICRDNFFLLAFAAIRLQVTASFGPSSRFQFGISSGYADEEILSDPRLALESALREQGLLAGGRGAAEYGLALVEPPTRYVLVF